MTFRFHFTFAGQSSIHHLWDVPNDHVTDFVCWLPSQMMSLPSLDLVAFGGADVATKYPCTYPGCLHVFHLRNTLLRHQRLKHGSPRARPVYSRRSWKLLDKPFSCDYPGCNRRYFSATGLRYNLRHKHWVDGVATATKPVMEQQQLLW